MHWNDLASIWPSGLSSALRACPAGSSNAAAQSKVAVAPLVVRFAVALDTESTTSMRTPPACAMRRIICPNSAGVKSRYDSGKSTGSRLLLRAGGREKPVTLELLSWREVDFAGVVLAGLVAGYVMAMAGLWAGRIPGLVAVDIADFGRRYVVADRPSAWFFGLASHLTNSVILTLVWATVVEPSFAAPRWLEGTGFGLVLAVALAGAL